MLYLTISPPPKRAHDLQPADAPSRKAPRLEPSTASTAPPAPQIRKPKLAAVFRKAHERDPEPLRAAESAFVDTQFEVEDAASYHDALLLLEGLVNRLNHPTRYQIRLLLSLSLFPLLFRPPTQSSSTFPSSRAAGPSTSTASSGPSNPRTRLVPHHPDPLGPVSHRTVREHARALLADVLGAQSGADLVGEAVRGYGLPGEARVARDRKAAEKKGKGKGKARAGNGGGEDPDAEAPHEGGAHDPLVAAANRMLDADDLWDVLGGTTARKERLWSKDRPVVEVGGWELLRVLVRAWEDEHGRKERQAAEDGAGTRPAPLSLLRYFRPSASSPSMCALSSKALDTVFWACSFSDEAHPDGDSDEDDESQGSEADSLEEDMHNATKRSKLAGERAAKGEQWREDDGTDLGDKREVAVRLLKLIGSSAVDGYFDASSTVSEIVGRMKGLSQAAFLSFIELVALVPTAKVFTARLLAAYLEAQSHAPSHTAHLHPALAALPSSQPTNGTNGPPSPRKLSTGGGANPAASQQRKGTAALAPYWRLPTLTSSITSGNGGAGASASPELLALFARLPIEVPLPPSSSSSSSAGAGKAKLPRSFFRAGEMSARHRCVKEALAEVLEELEMEREGREEGEAVGERAARAWEDVRGVMYRVADMIQEAKRRVEEQ